MMLGQGVITTDRLRIATQLSWESYTLLRTYLRHQCEVDVE